MSDKPVEYVSNLFNKGHIRNKICVCGSGKKLKKCHGSTTHIKKDVLEELIAKLEANAAAELQS